MKWFYVIWVLCLAFFLLLMFVLFCFPNYARSERIQLEWDPVENADGYRIFMAPRLQREDGSWGHEYDYSAPIIPEGRVTGDIPQEVNQVIVDLPEIPDIEQKYMFVARAFRGDEESVDSNETAYKVNCITPPRPIELVGGFDKDNSMIRIAWSQPDDGYVVHHWRVYFRLSEEDDFVELGLLRKDNPLEITTEFNVVPDGEQRTVQFVVVAYRRSGTFSANSAVLDVDVDRRGPIGPIQNLRINIEIPVI